MKSKTDLWISLWEQREKLVIVCGERWKIGLTVIVKSQLWMRYCCLYPHFHSLKRGIESRTEEKTV